MVKCMLPNQLPNTIFDDLYRGDFFQLCGGQIVIEPQQLADVFAQIFTARNLAGSLQDGLIHHHEDSLREVGELRWLNILTSNKSIFEALGRERLEWKTVAAFRFRLKIIVLSMEVFAIISGDFRAFTMWEAAIPWVVAHCWLSHRALWRMRWSIALLTGSRQVARLSSPADREGIQGPFGWGPPLDDPAARPKVYLRYIRIFPFFVAWQLIDFTGNIVDLIWYAPS